VYGNCHRESEDESSVWYYSTSSQLEELLLILDADKYERDLVQVIAEMREEIDRQMQLTEQLTKAVQAGRRSVIDVLNGNLLFCSLFGTAHKLMTLVNCVKSHLFLLSYPTAVSSLTCTVPAQ